MSRLLRLSVAALVYVGTIVAANWAIGHLGTPPKFPGAPHTIPVWPGVTAPSGVLFIAAALVLRDLVQWLMGRRAGQAPTPDQAALMILLVGVGAVVSYDVAAPKLATASALAFGFSELLDFGLFTWIAPRWARAVLVGGIAGAVVDSVIFLSVAFGSFKFLPGQILGKAYGVTLAALVIAVRRRRVAMA